MLPGVLTGACATALLVLGTIPARQWDAIRPGIWDKLDHAGGFALLMLLATWAWPRPGLIAIILVALGGLSEVLQWLSGWRDGDLKDWLADAAGIGLAYAVAVIVNAAYRRLATKRFVRRALAGQAAPD